MSKPATPHFPKGLRSQLRIMPALESIKLERAYHKCLAAAVQGRLPKKAHDEIVKDLVRNDEDFETIQLYLDSVRRRVRRHQLVELLKENLPGSLWAVVDSVAGKRGRPMPLVSSSSDNDDSSSDNDDLPPTFEISATFMDKLEL